MTRPDLRPPTSFRAPQRPTTPHCAVVATGWVLIGLASASAASAAGNTLTVNVGMTVRPVTHVAAGSRYGVDTGDTPPLSQLYPLHVNTFTQPPPGTQRLGNNATNPCCDGLQVAGKDVPRQLGQLARPGVEDHDDDHGAGQRHL